MEIFKGAQTHTQTRTHLALCIKSSVKPSCLIVVLSVCVLVFPLSGLAVDSADLLGRREEEKGSGKAN